MSYELFLSHQPAKTLEQSTTSTHSPSPQASERLDQETIGSFLLGLGSAIRFTGPTELGDQYIYEDEAGAEIEIMVSPTQIALGFPDWTGDAQAERAKRIAHAISLALVAKFSLTLYDPQTRRFIRSLKT